MNTVVEKVLNGLKSKASSEWLTPTQAQVFEKLTSHYLSHAMLNVYGPAGSGKTFLAWVLAAEAGYTYSSSLSPETWGVKTVLDVGSLGREEARHARSMMMLSGARRMVVLTRCRVPDDIVALGIEVTDEDLRVVKNNLLRTFGYQLLAPGQNLHDLIRANIEGGYIT